jgi:hypothetical protein
MEMTGHVELLSGRDQRRKMTLRNEALSPRPLPHLCVPSITRSNPNMCRAERQLKVLEL